MTSEEKRVIESVKEEYKKGIEQGNVLFPIFLNQAKIILSLIEKQSKEIEELKDESKEYQIGFAQGCYEKDLDWEDKIKAKIEEIEKLKTDDENSIINKIVNWFINQMQSLLEKE